MCARKQQKMQLDSIERFTSGIPESEFWQSFVQCMSCRSVMFCESGTYHDCTGISLARKRRYHPFRAAVRVQARLGPIPGDVPEAFTLRSLRESRAPTEVDDTLEGETPTLPNAVASAGEPSDDSGDETEVIPESDAIEAPLSSDFELPSMLQILGSTPTQSIEL